MTESELLYLFQANEPFLIFRDSFYEFTDSRKPVFQCFPVCSVADSHGMRFFEAVAWCNKCACFMIHIAAEIIGVHRKIVVDKRSRACLRTYVGNVRFTLDPRIKDQRFSRIRALLRERISSLWLRARAAIVSSIMPQLINYSPCGSCMQQEQMDPS